MIFQHKQLSLNALLADIVEEGMIPVSAGAFGYLRC